MSIFSEENQQNKSRLHQKVGQILNSPTFSSYRIYQEYPVNKLNPTYKNKKDRFDWVIDDLMIVIECHGAQHYNNSLFNGNNGLLYRKYKDMNKAAAAASAGYTYIEIPYTDIHLLNEQYIIQKYKTNYTMTKRRE